MSSKKLIQTTSVNSDIGFIEYNQYEIQKPDVEDLMRMLIISHATILEFKNAFKNIDSRITDFDENKISIDNINL